MSQLYATEGTEFSSAEFGSAEFNSTEFGSTEFGEWLNFWLSCEDMKQHENTTEETEATGDTASLNDTMNSDLEEDAVTMSRVNVDNTISVVSQAEIAEAHRRIDEPATVFQYEETADHDLLNLSVLTSEIEIVPPTKEFLTIPEGPLSHSTVSLIDDIFNLIKSDRLRLLSTGRSSTLKNCVTTFM